MGDRRTARAVALLVALPLAACDISTEAEEGGDVEIRSFRIAAAEPAGTVVDGRLEVSAGATLTFAFETEGPVERLVLAAGQVVLAELPGDATGYQDACTAGPCGTAGPGDVLYTLTALGEGDTPPADARSLVVHVVPAG